ncbi:alpha/beta hydrolase [Aeromicrobium sp. CF3.5]|uniref:alpha/beta hydrolase n=1 Tax=Aeromicrobium sp. CF3.5 TaxID=3373078 RepID=UPI003EE7C8E8
MTTWVEDAALGAGYEMSTIDLGDDPDGQGAIEATLVRATHAPDQRRGAVLYVHGFSDYFFQHELAEFWIERGYSFYALDLRKCGRSRREGQTAHYVSDLALYDVELDAALATVRAETNDAPVMLSGHSTGGLVLPLWLTRLQRRPGGAVGAGIAGLVLNSPWFDLQGAAWMRSIGTQAIRAVARVRPLDPIRLPHTDAYGSSLHMSAHGEWEYDVEWKPLSGFPITYGWLTAVRRGQSVLHKGHDIGVPSLVLHSTGSWFSRGFGDRVVGADAVLDVKQIARWAGCLGNEVTLRPIEGAKHDVFLSPAPARAAAYATIDAWLPSDSR